jgi:hypothetical protein
MIPALVGLICGLSAAAQAADIDRLKADSPKSPFSEIVA